jgi:quercetin dioxygenase-like cupin family protein
VVVNPYEQKNLNNGVFLRTFSKDVLSEELVWHRDHNERIVEVLDGENWEIQFENQLPQTLKVGEEYVIPAYTYHRIKRGTTDLVVKIQENLEG